jgi:hypothetical protein
VETPILGTLRPSVTDPPGASLCRLTCTDFPVNDLAANNVDQMWTRSAEIAAAVKSATL